MHAGTDLRQPAAAELAAVSQLLSQQRNAEAAQAGRALLERFPGDVALLHLHGIACTRLGLLDEALACLDRAVRGDPMHAPAWLALGNARRKSGDAPAAIAAFERALACDGRQAAARYNLAEAYAANGQAEAASRAVAPIVAANPLDFGACQLLVEQVAAWAREESQGMKRSNPTPATKRCITVGFCSIDRAREARARESLAAALAPWDVRFIVVRDARSLAEGFARIAAQCESDHLILCHDDIEVLSEGLPATLEDAWTQADIVGVAGATRAAGPAVLWAGHPAIHGWVSYPRGNQIEVAPLAFRPGLVTGIQTLDGVFMAMRTEHAREIGFDARTFDGFHFYDLDFSVRAHRAGLRLGVSTDVLLLHASEGRFEADWQAAARRFLAKYPELDAPQGAPHWYGAKVPDAATARRFYDRLRTVCSAAEPA